MAVSQNGNELQARSFNREQIQSLWQSMVTFSTGIVFLPGMQNL